MIKKTLTKQLIISLVLVLGFTAYIAKAEEPSITDQEPANLAVCDHNEDGKRNLSDVGMFAQCAETFDANGDGFHDLTDVNFYAVNNQDNTWCATEFDCVAKPIVETPELLVPAETLNVCDHNGDDKRNLSDVGYFASCINTFDVNGDNAHDLVDISLYTANNQNPEFCSAFVCETEPQVLTQSSELLVPAETLDICDHNGDKKRNLSDVGIFATCKDTFDLNDDGVHDLADIAIYAANNDNDDWCAEFACLPASAKTTSLGFGGGISAPDASKISATVSCEQVDIAWETSKDSLTWLVYGDSTVYDQEYKNEDFSPNHSVILLDLPYNTTYNYMVKTEGLAGDKKDDYNYTFTTPTAEQCGVVLGEKISNVEVDDITGPIEEEKQPEECKYSSPDQDVLGKTDWEDGTLLRGCGPEIYVIENQQKRHITSLSELLNYIGQRIYNVTNDILSLF